MNTSDTTPAGSPSVSIVIPAYNEEQGIPQVLQRLEPFVQEHGFQVIVVNDGSTDRTAEVVAGFDWVDLVDSPYNKGYGASIKSGVRAARGEWILTMDADGQHPPEAMVKLLERRDRFDMVIGARQSTDNQEWIRVPGKWVLTRVANFLSGMNIPDVNSGLRLFRKEFFKDYQHILPNGFSISTTLTLAFISGGLNVDFVPFAHDRRTTGKSRVNQCRDGAITILLIIRCITLFNPLKFYAPLSAAIFVASSLFALLGIVVYQSFPKTSIVGILSSIILLCFGILADQVSSMQRKSH